MAGTTYANLTTDIRNYTEVDDSVFTQAIDTLGILDISNQFIYDLDECSGTECVPQEDPFCGCDDYWEPVCGCDDVTYSNYLCINGIYCITNLFK